MERVLPSLAYVSLFVLALRETAKPRSTVRSMANVFLVL